MGRERAIPTMRGWVVMAAQMVSRTAVQASVRTPVAASAITAAADTTAAMISTRVIVGVVVISGSSWVGLCPATTSLPLDGCLGYAQARVFRAGYMLGGPAGWPGPRGWVRRWGGR